jgi:hypothetical protein
MKITMIKLMSDLKSLARRRLLAVRVIMKLDFIVFNAFVDLPLMK